MCLIALIIPLIRPQNLVFRSHALNSFLLSLSGLQIPNIQSNLPEVDARFTGREQEVGDLTDLVTSGRIVTITGCYGIGKSSLAVAVAHEQQKKFVCPILIDLRGAVSNSSVIQRICRHFGLHFKQNEMHMLFNWLNCHEQRLLFILDNLEAPASEDERLSDFIDDLMFNVKDLRILTTSRRNYFRGQSSGEVYRLGNISSVTEGILETQLPDLHTDGRQGLAEHTDHVPWAIHFVCSTFKMEDMDTGALAEALLAPEMSYHAGIEDAINKLTDDETEQQTLLKVTSCLNRVLSNIPENYSDLLNRVSCFAASFDSASAAKLSPGEPEEVPKILDALCVTGLVYKLSNGRYILPAVVKLTVLAKISDNGLSHSKYTEQMVEALKTTCSRYHSRESREAIADFEHNVDNYADVLWRVMDAEDTYDVCGSFCSLEYAIFLSKNIFDDIYVMLYDTMEQQASDKGDTRRQSLALCCLAYHHVTNGHVEKAKLAVEKAYGIIHDQETLHELDKAFCLYVMGLVHWENPDVQNKALMLVKKALDIFKLSQGVRSLRTLYVNETYGWMLTQKESHQTARHFYNISDFVVRETLAEHPVLIPGFDCRRAIWDRLCLFARATDTAKLVYEISRDHYGDHPQTATMAQNHCEAIIKRGSLNDAISAAVNALAVRCRVLGDHEDTAHSYKVMAYLMLRSGQYDEAVRFGQNAAEIYDKLDTNERLKIEVRNIMAQARYRLEYKSSNFIQLESKNAARKASSTPTSPMDDTLNTTIGSITTSISTEV